MRERICEDTTTSVCASRLLSNENSLLFELSIVNSPSGLGNYCSQTLQTTRNSHLRSFDFIQRLKNEPSSVDVQPFPTQPKCYVGDMCHLVEPFIGLTTGENLFR